MLHPVSVLSRQGRHHRLKLAVEIVVKGGGPVLPVVGNPPGVDEVVNALIHEQLSRTRHFLEPVLLGGDVGVGPFRTRISGKQLPWLMGRQSQSRHYAHTSNSHVRP